MAYLNETTRRNQCWSLLIPVSLQESIFMQIKLYFRLINRHDMLCDKSQISFPFFVLSPRGQGYSWADTPYREHPAMGCSDEDRSGRWIMLLDLWSDFVFFQDDSQLIHTCQLLQNYLCVDCVGISCCPCSCCFFLFSFFLRNPDVLRDTVFVFFFSFSLENFWCH